MYNILDIISRLHFHIGLQSMAGMSDASRHEWGERAHMNFFISSLAGIYLRPTMINLLIIFSAFQAR